MNPVIEAFSTARMIAERLRFEHFAEIDTMHQDPQVMATLGGVRSPEQTRQFIDKNLEHWERYGFGLWVFRDKVNGKFIGRGGVRYVNVAGNDVVELAYALMSAFWGQGLATEMGESILKIAIEQLGFSELACFTMTTNFTSQRVIQKLGFRYEGDIVHANLPHVFYRLQAPHSLKIGARS
ncbi:GNAT family N-acetyltransferase [Nostoc sp. TCL26-01]|uniref:GNAT family N-acetyltransferase n=1 Tax=Nostoc sp. TCL26-01 TaxID=2576904 RepID=UPI0021199759|nr:GNAT family N-acetyltransferase [Nostoc sp. TCL26-01]